MQTRRGQIPSNPVVIQNVRCPYCGRTDLKNKRGLAIHVRRSKECGSPPVQESAFLSLLVSSSPINRPFLITVQNMFIVIINVPYIVKCFDAVLMLLYNIVNHFIDIPLLINRSLNGFMLIWTFCTDPDRVTTPIFPSSVQPYWNKIYEGLNKLIDMALFSRRLFAVWKFLVTPIQIDTEEYYAKLSASSALPRWLKDTLIKLCRFIELILGSYLISRALIWMFGFLLSYIPVAVAETNSLLLTQTSKS